MSDSRERPGDDDRAGLYVLGVLDAAEMTEVRRAAMADDRLAAEIAAWEARLAPLAALAGEETPPPEVWDTLVARLDDIQVVPIRPPPAPHTPAYWRTAALGAMAVAASLAGALVWKFVQPPPRLAMIMPLQQSLGGWLIELNANGGLRAIAQGSVHHAGGKCHQTSAVGLAARRRRCSRASTRRAAEDEIQTSGEPGAKGWLADFTADGASDVRG
jgi:hypothetical protein